MKIVYSAGNRLGAGFQLKDFLDHNTHEIKIAGYFESTREIQYVDWTLNAAENPDVIKILLQEIKEFQPDLIISDAEPIIANIAKTLNVQLWYCSSLHLFDGIEWGRGQLNGYSYQLEELRFFFRKMPLADRVFVYSPFGDIKNPPSLRKKYEWVQPYHFSVENSINQSLQMAVVPESDRISDFIKILNSLDICPILFKSKSQTGYKENLTQCNWYLSTGHTRFVSDAFYNNKTVSIAPSCLDVEEILNAILCSHYKLGMNIGQVELLDRFGPEEIEKSLNFVSQKDYLNMNVKKLHERINEL